MADLLTHESIIIGGWFGTDGESAPSDGVYAGGWFGGPESLQDISDRIARIEALLISNKPIFINSDGIYEELRL